MSMYFVNCPDCGFEEYETIEDRDRAAIECIAHHLDDGWDEDVTNVRSGVIVEKAEQTNIKVRPDNLDENDCDGEGTHWNPDFSYLCDYVMTPITE